MKVSALAGLVTLVAFAALAACSNPKPEARALVEAVDRYRRAELPAKPAAVGAIDAATCADAEVCAAKRACLATAQPTARGAALKAQVESSLADLRAGTLTAAEVSARALPEKLDEAQRLLDEGHRALGDCDARVLALRLKYGL